MRIDVYGASAEDAAGARVVLLFEGAPLFQQKQLPAEGILPARIAIELEDVEWPERLGDDGRYRCRSEGEQEASRLEVDVAEGTTPRNRRSRGDSRVGQATIRPRQPDDKAGALPGQASLEGKTIDIYVWPVRGGQ